MKDVTTYSLHISITKRRRKPSPKKRIYLGWVVQSPVKLGILYCSFAFSGKIIFVYVVCPSVLNLDNL